MRWLIAALTVMALAGVAGCTEDETTVPDGEIVKALDLKRDDERPVYAIGGDEFCEIDDNLLNDTTEVEQATSTKQSEGLVLTNREQSVGVQVIPPFDPACERDARKALGRIDVG